MRGGLYEFHGDTYYGDGTLLHGTPLEVSMTILVEVRTKQEHSLAIYGRAEDAAYQAQAFGPCEHIWEKVDDEVHQCETCGDICDLRGK